MIVPSLPRGRRVVVGDGRAALAAAVGLVLVSCGQGSVLPGEGGRSPGPTQNLGLTPSQFRAHNNRARRDIKRERAHPVAPVTMVEASVHLNLVLVDLA